MNTYETPVTEVEVEEVKGRKGVTLIEALFVLGIMAVLIGMVMVLLSQTTSSTKTNQLTEEITTIVDAAHQLYQGQPAYDSNVGTAIASSGLLPSRYINSNTIVSPFGATITLTNTTINGVSAVDFSIPNVPQTTCVKLSTTDFGNGLLNRGPVSGSSSNSASGSPASPSEAATSCTSTNTLTFDFE